MAKIYEVFDDANHMYLLSDYFKGEDLFAALRKRTKFVTEMDIA